MAGKQAAGKRYISQAVNDVHTLAYGTRYLDASLRTRAVK